MTNWCRRIITNAAQLITSEFSDWARSIDAVYRYMCDPEGVEQAASVGE